MLTRLVLRDGGFVSTGTSSEDGSGVFLLSQVPELIRDANMKYVSSSDTSLDE
jgi:hypothetical protein